MAKSKPTTPSETDFDPTVGVRPRAYDFFEMSSRTLGLAQRFLPILNRFIITMCVISVLAMTVSLVSVYMRHNPQVLLTFPDGATRCALPPLDPTTRQPKSRPAWEEEVCQRLSQSSFDPIEPGAAP